jgi:hypothetical protein
MIVALALYEQMRLIWHDGTRQADGLAAETGLREIRSDYARYWHSHLPLTRRNASHRCGAVAATHVSPVRAHTSSSVFTYSFQMCPEFSSSCSMLGSSVASISAQSFRSPWKSLALAVHCGLPQPQSGIGGNSFAIAMLIDDGVMASLTFFEASQFVSEVAPARPILASALLERTVSSAMF